MEEVKHPKHYAEGRRFEPIEVIKDWGLDFDLGNVVKYVSRAGRKGSALEDLEKAREYLSHEIMYLRKERCANEHILTEEEMNDLFGAKKETEDEK